MGLFMSKIEREMMEEMKREEQLQVFNEKINELKTKRQEYAKIAAEAEINGDRGTYDVAVNALIELNNIISNLMQTKANFDIINVSNSIASTMSTAINALEVMSNTKRTTLDLRKIQKISLKVKNYMKRINISQKAMGRMMATSNPANVARSSEEVSAVRPMIDAEISRLVGGSVTGLGTTATTQQATNDEFDLTNEILAQKNNTII